MEGTRASRGGSRLCRESALPLPRASLGSQPKATCRWPVQLSAHAHFSGPTYSRSRVTQNGLLFGMAIASSSPRPRSPSAVVVTSRGKG